MADTTVLGFIIPEVESPQDETLEDIMQATIAGITGLPSKMVRPAFQPVVPNQPAHDVDWCAYKVVVGASDNDAHLNHQPALLVNGETILERDQKLLVTLSFYGPEGSRMRQRWIDGLSIDQNRWVLQDYGIKFVEHAAPVNLPTLLKEKWVRRIDLTTTFSRRTSTKYPIRTIANAGVDLNNEYYVTHISTNP